MSLETEDRQVRVIGDSEVGSLLSAKASIEALEAMYAELGVGTAVDRVRTRTSLVPNDSGTADENFRYVVNSMEGGGSACGYYAMRLNSVMWEWIDTPDGGRRKIRPQRVGNHHKFDGMVFLFDVNTSLLVAILPNFSVSRRRVAGSSGVAAKYMARPESDTLGIIGSGSHAIAHAMAFAELFPLSQIRVWSPTRSHVESFCQRLSGHVDVEIVAAADARDVVGSDLVVTATNSMGPVFDANWVGDGTHVTSINPPEVAEGMAARADVVVVKGKGKTEFFNSEQAGPEKKGSSKGSADADFEQVADLGQVVAGGRSVRSSAGEVSFFLNNVGLGSEFAALGGAVYRLAKESDVGHQLPLAWFCTPDVSPIFGEAWQQS